MSEVILDGRLSCLFLVKIAKAETVKKYCAERTLISVRRRIIGNKLITGKECYNLK